SSAVYRIRNDMPATTVLSSSSPFGVIILRIGAIGSVPEPMSETTPLPPLLLIVIEPENPFTDTGLKETSKVVLSPGASVKVDGCETIENFALTPLDRSGIEKTSNSPPKLRRVTGSTDS